MGLMPETMEVNITKEALLGEGATLCALHALLAKAHAELNTQAVDLDRKLVGKPMMHFNEYSNGIKLLSKYTSTEGS